LNPSRGNRKVCDTQVSQIKAHLKIGVSAALLARYFKVSVDCVRMISRGISWPHVKPAANLEPIRPERILPIRLRDHRLAKQLQELSHEHRPS
jgi:hypothetical protein